MATPDPDHKTRKRAVEEPIAERKYLTIGELSAATTLSVSTIRRLVRSGKLTAVQPGGPRHRMVFPQSAVDQLPGGGLAPVPGPAVSTRSEQSPHTRGPKPRWTKT